MTQSQIRELRFLVFKRGGVSGAIRRIVFQRQGVFTASMIHERLLQRYPLLTPNTHQLSDCLASMERQNKIHRVMVNDCGIIYKTAPVQLFLDLGDPSAEPSLSGPGNSSRP